MNSAPPSHIAEPEEETPEQESLRNLHTIKLLILGIFLLIFAACLFLARDFLLPVSLAFLFALVLSPVVRWLQRRGIPSWVTAGALVVVLFLGLSSGVYFLSGPVAAVIADAPRISGEVQKKLAVLRQPIAMLSAASRQLQTVAQPSDGVAPAAVVVEDSGLVGVIASGAPGRLVEIGLCLILVLFILASGDLFYEKLIKVLPTLSDKKLALRIAREIEHEVSRYLFTISVINAGLGAIVCLAFWAIGMPSPLLWGLLALVLNYLPYLGPTLGAVSAFGIGVVAFDTLGQAMLAPLVYVFLCILEGQFFTPMIVGRRLELNAVVILIAISFWGWLWGIVGALIAVPLLVTIKIFADHLEGMRGVGEFLGVRDANGHAEKAEAAEAPTRAHGL